MNKFKTWYVTHQDAITWFLIGWLSSAGLYELAHSNYIWAAVLFVIAFLNYAVNRVRLS
jgi:hypothetical protein